jgi:addiction module HigA family antidote
MTAPFQAPAPTVGDHLKQDFLPEYGLKAPTFAKRLGVPRSRMVRLLDGARCDGDMALRLARAFGTTPEFWLNLQARHDLTQAQCAAGDQINQDIEPLSAA